MKTRITDQGDLTINLIDLFEQMDDEQKQLMVEHFAWHSPIWHELVRSVSDEYAAENFNSSIYKMRLEFFQSSHVPSVLRQTIRSLLSTIKNLQQKERAYTNVLGQWRAWYDAHKGEGQWQRPVPWPEWDLEWADESEVADFMRRTGIEEVF